MLFGGAVGEGLEPVGHVGDAVGESPFLHPFGHFVGRAAVELTASFDAFEEG